MNRNPVKKGDTLYQISREYKISVSMLLSYNKLQSTDTLRIGQEIRIPSSYIVVRGDTLYGIARDAGIELDELCRINTIDKNPNTIAPTKNKLAESKDCILRTFVIT